MAYEMRPESGTLFKNDRKEKDTHPDYTGEALIGGTPYYMSAWIKDGKKGKFMSFAFKPKDAAGRAEPRQAATKPDDLEDVPF